MAANLQIFEDSNCTQELSGGNPYTLQIGPTTGIDGTNGGSVTKQLWIKNTGDILVSNVTLAETSDTPNRGSYSLDNNTFDTDSLDIGDMDPTDVVTFYVKVTVAALSSPAANVALNFTTSGTYTA